MKLVFVWNIQISFQLLNTGMKYHHDVRSTQSRYASISKYYKQINIETFKTIFSNDRTYWSYLHWKIKKPNEPTTTTCYPCDPLTTTVLCCQEVPIILAGNKTDLADVEREIYVEDVRDWLEQEFKQNKWGQIRGRPREDKRKQNTYFYKLVFTLFVFYSSPRLGACKSLH